MMQQINADKIPDELKQRKCWVVWKYLIRHGKKTKIPFQMSGAEAKTNDPSTWDTFDTALRRFAAGAWEGIGFVFSPDDPYTGIDLDGCRNPDTKVIEPWAKEIICSLGGYAELSPSLSGVKIWVKASWPQDAGHKVPVPDAAKVCDKEPGIEIYDWGRFFTVTGRVLAGQTTIGDGQDAVDRVRTQFFKTAKAPVAPQNFRSEANIIDRARKYIAKLEPAIDGQNGSGRTFHAACVLVKGFGLSEDDALGLMKEWNVTHCQPEWSERELIHKVSDAAKATGESGYLRNVSPENYDHVPIPNHQPNYIGQIQTQHPNPVEVTPKPGVTVTTMEQASFDYLTAVSQNNERLVDLGLPDLDCALGGGVEPGEMIIFAARPSHGKSMAAAQVAHNFCERGTPVVFFSEEMSALALGKRVIQFVSEVPNEHWKTRETAVRSQLTSHFSKRAPCYIVEGCRTAERVAEELQRFVEEKQVGLAVVDYAQLLSSTGKNRYETVTNVSMALKGAANKCQIPVIVLCQMSRAIEGREHFVPRLSDLKESGQFEQDADVIVFQVWPHKLNPNAQPNEYQLFVAKNRNRPINTQVIDCKFEPSRQRLVDDKPVPRVKDYGYVFDNSTEGVAMDPGMLDFDGTPVSTEPDLGP